MRTSSLLVLLPLTVLVCSAAQEVKFPLPGDAHISLGSSEADTALKGSQDCKTFHLTSTQARRRFRLSRQVEGADLRDYNLPSSCFMNGKVSSHGQSFDYKMYKDGYTVTAFPDGKNKLLVSSASDDPDEQKKRIQAQVHLAFPIGAEIKPEGLWSDPKDVVVREACKDFSLGPSEVRSRFRTYHLLDGSEYHDFYAWYPCWSHGKVMFKGRTFNYKINLGNTLETDYPDGTWKVLGGKYTDDPSVGEGSAQYEAGK